MINFEIVESAFSRKSSSNYELSILQRMDSFVYAVTDDQFRVLVLRDYALASDPQPPEPRREELAALPAQDEVLSLPFRHRRIGLVTPHSTLVPNRLFNPQEKNTYLEQLIPLDDTLEVRSDDLEGLAVQNIYAYPKSLLNWYRRVFPDAAFCHSGSSMLAVCRTLASHWEGYQIFVHVWGRNLQAILYQGRDLLFINTFSYRSTKDFTYYVMLVFDQFSLDPQETPLHLSGQVLADSEVFRFLSRYVRRIDFLLTPPFINPGTELKKSPGHLYFDLFSLIQA